MEPHRKKQERVLRQTIYNTINQLETWANESVTGGWSTHQVKPMRKLADELKVILFDNSEEY